MSASTSAQSHAACPNETILRGLRRGEPAAQRALYDRFCSPVSRTVGRLLGPDNERSDVIQQAFVNIITSIGSVDNPECLEGWVYQVAVNTVRREIRSRKYRRVVQYHWAPPHVSDLRSSPEHRLFSHRFYKALESLNPKHRTVLVEFYLEGTCVAGIARRGGCSVATAKRRLARARTALGKRVRRDPVLASAL